MRDAGRREREGLGSDSAAVSVISYVEKGEHGDPPSVVDGQSTHRGTQGSGDSVSGKPLRQSPYEGYGPIRNRLEQIHVSHLTIFAL